MTSFSCIPPALDSGGASSLNSGLPMNRPAEGAARTKIEANERVSALGEMTAGLAHDFRNILAVVQSGINVAKRAGPDSPNWDLAWAAIDEAIGRGLRLTGELLVFARGGTPDVHTENINELLAGATTIMNYGAGPGVQVKMDLAPSLPDCLVDPVQFSSAILNLVVNARDAMPQGGEIRIATDECLEACRGCEATAERWVRVRVSDQGSGMSADVVEHLFDPYFTTKGEAGTGLGVPQVVAFMRASGGSVCVSTEPGAGSCFDLRFPAVYQAAHTDGNLGQLDRWVNEGGSDRQRGGRAKQPRRDELADPLHGSAATLRRLNRAEVSVSEVGTRVAEHALVVANDRSSQLTGWPAKERRLS